MDLGAGKQEAKVDCFELASIFVGEDDCSGGWMDEVGEYLFAEPRTLGGQLSLIYSVSSTSGTI